MMLLLAVTLGGAPSFESRLPDGSGNKTPEVKRLTRKLVSLQDTLALDPIETVFSSLRNVKITQSLR